ncbi:MAG: hypothetical protein AAFV88_13700 [Planctomycetota bacterium]
MNLRRFGSGLIVVAMATWSHAASPVPVKGRTVARLFWQNDADATVQCGDLKKSANGWAIERLPIEGFPSLDPDRQSLVQMRMHDGLLLVGVRETEDGTIGNGWIAIESGVEEEPHGDHSHWRYSSTPKVSRSLIDTEQGNPAHVYKCDDSFVLANDSKNGFTVTSAEQIRQAKTNADAATFYRGGNGHITLAVDPNKVAYATWIAPAGPDSGRVDVIGLGNNEGKSYSFQCPSGMLHGATMNAGKAFFAPLDGICWVAVDEELTVSPDSVAVHHLSLGKDEEDNPLRTGAFVNSGDHVVFTAGKGAATKLCWVDASADQPAVNSLPIQVDEGEAASTPVLMKSRYGDSLAVLFGQFKETPEKDRMVIFNLDPNRDGQFDDAKLHQSVGIGPNQMMGHSGYHGVTMLPDRRHALVTNPGDGSLWVISLRDFQVRGKLDLDGTPTRLLVTGG